MKKHNSHWVRLALTFGLVLNALPVAAAPLRIEPLVGVGKWPEHTRGTAYDVKVVGNRAYLVLRLGGLVILDVSRDVKLHSVLLGWSDPDQALCVAAGTPRKHAPDGRRPSGRYSPGYGAFPVM